MCLYGIAPVMASFLYRLKMEGFYMGQPAYYQPLWSNGSVAFPGQEMERLQCLPRQRIIEEYIAIKASLEGERSAKASLEGERSATMKYVQDLQRDKMIQVRMQATACALLGCLKTQKICVQCKQYRCIHGR